MRGIGEVTKVQERSLTGTWNISDLQRWSWKTNESVRKEGEISPLIGNYNIWSDKYLNPIE